jgi:hypothetical protein
MSSPGVGKVTRAVQPWPKDYHTPVATMDTDKILRSTLTEETHTQKGDTKTCLLCRLSYFFRSIRCREHLGLTDSSKQVQQCKAYPEHLERSSQVVKELKERDAHVKQEDREVVKRSLESGQLGDSIVVENFGKRARSSNDGPFKIVRTNWSVCMYVMCQTYQ